MSIETAEFHSQIGIVIAEMSYRWIVLTTVRWFALKGFTIEAGLSPQTNSSPKQIRMKLGWNFFFFFNSNHQVGFWSRFQESKNPSKRLLTVEKGFISPETIIREWAFRRRQEMGWRMRKLNISILKLTRLPPNHDDDDDDVDDSVKTISDS